MDQEEGEESYAPWCSPKTRKRGANHRCSENTVQQIMMVLLIEKEVIPAFHRVLGKISHDACSVQVRENAAEGDQPAVTEIVSGFGRNQPTGE